jgi:hypothetical protein
MAQLERKEPTVAWTALDHCCEASDMTLLESGSETGDAVAPPARPPARKLTLGTASFCLACLVMGFFVALIVGVVFHEVLGEPLGLLLAVSAAAWALTSILLYQVGGQRVCDRVIVMGGGFVSAVLCSLTLLD